MVEEQSTKSAGARRASPWHVREYVWTFSTYFAEGFPYSLVRNVSTAFFTFKNASLEAIGLTSLLGLPWNLKFVWAPLVDHYATKRSWIVAVELLIVAAIAALAAASPAGGGLAIATVMFVVLAVLAATHDIAIDGYYLEALDKEGQARYVGYRVMAYRLALVAGQGGVVFLAGAVGWGAAFAAAAAVFAMALVYHAAFLPRVEKGGATFGAMFSGMVSARNIALLAGVAAGVFAARWASGTGALAPIAAPFERVLGPMTAAKWIAIALLILLLGGLAVLPRVKRSVSVSGSHFARSLSSLLDQPRTGVIVAFVLLFRAGESMLLGMVTPFLKGIGVTLDQIGFAYGTVGTAAGIAGAMAGGWLIARLGMRRVAWPFVLSQNVLNFLYMFMAWHCRGIFFEGDAAARPASFASANLSLVTAMVSIEAFGAGLGTAFFSVFIMRCCKPEFKASHMAFLTAFMSVSATFAGVFSGIIASAAGFTVFFGITFLATVPAMVLLPFLPHMDSVPRPRT
ncbi:MAG: MFS transporter [Deltaproteobacteria bacterium]|nr:MFS transporter [Deltaproteobacteria bacterium]